MHAFEAFAWTLPSSCIVQKWSCERIYSESLPGMSVLCPKLSSSSCFLSTWIVLNFQVFWSLANSVSRAIENGANAIAEGFLFTVAAALILGETWRTSRNQSKRRDSVDDQLDELGTKVTELTARLDNLTSGRETEMQEEKLRWVCWISNPSAQFSIWEKFAVFWIFKKKERRTCANTRTGCGNWTTGRLGRISRCTASHTPGTTCSSLAFLCVILRIKFSCSKLTTARTWTRWPWTHPSCFYMIHR